MISYFIHTSFCWAMFLGVYLLLFRQEKFFAVNRVYLLSAILLGLLLPLLQYFPTPQNYEQPFIVDQYIQQVTVVQNWSETFIQPAIEQGAYNYSMPWWMIFKFMYLAGIVFAIGKMIQSFMKIFHIYRTSEVIEKEDYSLILLDKRQMPFSFFKSIFLDRKALSDPNFERILQHEKNHVKSLHSLDILFVEIVKLFFWWNPIIYLIKISIIQNHEFAADQSVIYHSSRKQYCQLLMQKNFPNVQLALTHSFFKTQIKNRINMMYKNDSSRLSGFKYVLIIPMLLSLTLFFISDSVAQKINVDNSSEFEMVKTKIDDVQSPVLENSENQIIPIKEKRPESREATLFKAEQNPVLNNSSNDCKSNEYGVYYRSTKSPSVVGCPQPDEPFDCVYSRLHEFARAMKRYPAEALKEGYQGVTVFKLEIDEKGNISKVRNPKNRPFYSMGLQEEGMRLVELIKKEFEFIPAECDGQKVPSQIMLAMRYMLEADDMDKVMVKNSRTVGEVTQMVNISNVSSEGKLGFVYTSNMNVPTTITITNPKGDRVFSKTYPYKYKTIRDMTPLSEKINGTYTINIDQDGQLTKGTMECTVF